MNDPIPDRVGESYRMQDEPINSIAVPNLDLPSLELHLQQEDDASEPQNRNIVDICALGKTTEHVETLESATLSDASVSEGTGVQTQALLRATTGPLGERFKKSPNVEDLDISIELEHAALQQTPENHPDRAEWLSRLGSSYQHRFDQLGHLEDLGRAIEFNNQALLNTVTGHDESLKYLNNLGNAYGALFHRLGRLDDLKRSVSCKEQAVLLAPDGYPEKPVYLNNLGNSYHSLFERLGILEDLHKAVNCKEQAILLAPDDHPNKPAMLNNLGNSFQSLFGCFEQAVLLAPDGYPLKPEWLSNLGSSYLALFERLGRSDDINKSVSYLEQAVLSTLDGHPNKPMMLNNLGNSFQSLFEHLGNLTDMDKSVSCLKQAVLLTQDGHPNKPMYLNNLGGSYHSLFERLGRLDDLDKSINYKEQAVLLTPDDHPHKPGQLSNLGNSYQSLFEQLGRLDDIQKSVSCLEQAVLLAPDGHPGKPAYLNNLGNSYQSLSKQLGTLDDIDKSVNCKEQAVSLTPEGHPDKPRYLNNLGNSYQALFDQLGELDNIHKSIDCKEQAISLTPDGHPFKLGWLSSLGSSYQSLFERLGKLQDANQATSCLKRAALLTPVDHPYQTIHLNKLGAIYWSMFKRSQLPDHAMHALSYWKSAALTSTGPPFIRLQSSRMWALLSRLGDPPSLEAHTHCLALLPQVVWLGVPAHDRYEWLANKLGILATEMATAAIELKRYDLAVEWLEQGRSVVWGQTLQLRAPYDELYAIHPEMANELQYVSYRLECASISHPEGTATTVGGESPHETAWKHRQLAQRREELLDAARLLPGLEDFPRPPKASTIMSWVQDKTIVIVNVHELQCDALVIQAGTRAIAHVSLSRFSVQKAESARAELARCLRAQGSRRGVKKGDGAHTSTLINILATLWYDVAKPVLDHLGIIHPLPVDHLPHITWCTTGPLSFLPLHAAGDYSSPSTMLSNLAISSYTPTIGTLKQHTSSPGTFSGILAVGHESAIPTRGFISLPGTRNELDRVQEQAKCLSLTRLDDEGARIDTVLEAMKDHSWVHFACHASQNPLDPMKSALHLHDGDLDLATIARNSLKNAQLAFLSACQTATGDSALPDESVHLAAGLLMAGYPTVIATMWSIYDQDAPLVAGKFYECLLEGGQPDSRKAAKALHKAVASLREKIGIDQFARWVPYVHIGR